MRLEKLYETRTAKGWSQYDLAAESGVPQQTISRAENGLNVTRRVALMLAGSLGVEPDDLSVPQETVTITLPVSSLPAGVLEALIQQ